jgi:hypothetical protein
MNYTFATVIIADDYKAQAQAELAEQFFTAPLSFDGKAPVTHWMSSGAWDNAQLDFIVNEAEWPSKVSFGDSWQEATDAEGLKLVSDTQQESE